jgi:hypothetical protein
MTQAANAYKTAEATLKEAKNNGCDIGATRDKYQNLQNSIQVLKQKAQELNKKIADSGKSLLNKAWNGVLNAAEQLEGEGNCSKVKVPGLTGGFVEIIYKAICYAIAAVSAALGGFACLLAEQIIDPVFSNGQKTCETKKIGLNSGGGSPAPSISTSSPAPSNSGSSSPPASSTPTAPRPTVEG